MKYLLQYNLRLYLSDPIRVKHKNCYTVTNVDAMNEPVNVMLLSPAEREANKTRAQRAEDIAYTLNHALSCGTNDMFIAPTISALLGVQVGCADPTHDHGVHEHHHHDHHPHNAHDGRTHRSFSKWPAKFLPPEPSPQVQAAKKFDWKIYRSEALHYLKGEIVGDALAVPLTIATQRFFPALMAGIGTLVEPVAAPFFRRGANASAEKWGADAGLDADAPEVVARAQALYHSEMQHLPQAVMWNVFAFPIGVVTQKMGGHGSSYARIIRNKSIGALISNALLLGGRAMAPNIAQQWDAMNSRYLIAPVTGLVGEASGLKHSDVARWAARVQSASPEEAEQRTP